VAKKLNDIKEYIESSNLDFNEHLIKVLNKDVIDFLERLKKLTNVYVFSGVIRNYFLRQSSIRDLDLVVEFNEEARSFIESNEFIKNSFDGYKLDFSDLKIDLWFMEDTWAINTYQKILEFYVPEFITSTAFFNFSCILFDFQSKEFIIRKEFLRFIRDKELELVFEPNPNVKLCIINSLYYSDKYELKIGQKLKEYLIRKLNIVDPHFQKIQLKHFGEIFYSDNVVIERINSLKLEMTTANKRDDAMPA